MRIDPPASAKAAAPDTSEPLSNAPLAGEDQSPSIPDTLPILPIREAVLFPGTALPLTVGRHASRKLLEESLPQSKIIGVFTQKNSEQENPGPDDLHSVGVAASVLKFIRQPDDSVVIIVNGLERIAIRKLLLTHPFIRAEVEVLRSPPLPAGDKQWQSTVEQQIAKLRNRLAAAQPPKEVIEQTERELRRLGHIHPASPEFSVIVSYVETVAELPWSKLSEDKLDLEHAQQILDRDHFDLEKVKRRLIEYLAVRKLNPGGHGPILCFLGPPGVGKTSLGQSIADALGRRFVRLSLGGVHDEAEIRGHRRTYIGSMPGRIIQELRRAGSRNPVMMLD